MAPEQEHHPVGAHRLGPHVVGQRVVVRRLLRGATGPTGGPAMTDLLGTCLSWGAGVCVVQPEDGPSVEIALGDVVSGKPVPPRASVRHRVAPRDAQVRAFALFPDLVTSPLGGWVVRHSATSPARRANSVLAFGPSGEADDVLRVLAAYSRPVVAVLAGSPEQARFEALGWVPESNDSDTVFQLAGVSAARRTLRGVDTSTVALTPDGPTVIARVGDRASGVAAYSPGGSGWVGFRGLEVSPTHRRQGLARVVMAALLEWGAEQGATTAYLQVLGDNTPALALYAALGFTDHHRYRYLTL